MRILHFIPHLGRAQGGPVHALHALLVNQADTGNIHSIFSTPRDEDGSELDFTPTTAIHRFNNFRALGFRYSPSLSRQVKQPDRINANLVHSHLLWTHCHFAADRYARKRSIPHLISPCGTLDPGALRHRGFKKSVMGKLFQRAAVRRASCIHAKSEHEKEAIRQYAPGVPIALIPNIISPPDKVRETEISWYQETHFKHPDEKHLLFLGRIHQVKNLANLIRGWASVCAEFPNWRLILAGPDEEHHQTHLEHLAKQLGIDDRLGWTGILNQDQKWAALACSEYLVLPSYFENFGLAAAEALAMGKPVIASNKTPWSELETRNAGFWVDLDAESIAAAMKKLCEIDDVSRQAMGTRGKELVSSFSPDQVQRSWSDLYRWLTGEGPPPSCVST